MQKLIGGLLVLTATAGAGFVYSRELKLYLERILYLRYVLSLIKGEIGYTHAPLPEVLSQVAKRVREPYRLWLNKTAREIRMRKETSFARTWSRCVDKYLKALDLKYEHVILLKEPGTFLGSLEADTLDQTMQLYLNRMDLEAEKLREGLAAKVRISRCLGVMSGIFFIVILL